MEQNQSAAESAVNEQRLNPCNDIVYQIDKMTFVVTPVHRDGSGKTIHDILLSLMEKDCETP
jgi:hypothetical protein